MHKHIRIALASAAAVALTGGLLSLSTGSALAADSTHVAQADFNGDGIGDIAEAAGNATVSTRSGAGQIVVLYGTTGGINATTPRQTLSQNSTGVPGTAETNDGFGWTSAYGDFNHDGYDDLAVGAAKEDVDGDTDGGTVAVLWGSASGLKAGVTIKDPAVSSHDKWGKSLAAGDFDGDGKDDLAIGSTASTIYVYKGGITSTGTSGGRYTVKPPLQSGGSAGPIMLTAGDVNGDHRTDLVVDGFEQSATGWNMNYFVPGTATGLSVPAGRRLKPGVITEIGDVNGDGFGDIVSGIDWDADEGGRDHPDAHKGGQVCVTYGSVDGPVTTDAINQDSGNIPGASETDDMFGSELSLGDIDGDGLLDLAIGAPGEDLNGIKDAGSVTVLYGTGGGAGLSTTDRVQYFTQNTSYVPNQDETSDGFGGEVKLDDVSGDGKADLIASAPWENAGNGNLIYLRSNGTQITTDGAKAISPTNVGVDTAGYPDFGANAAN
ncbi:FG-GAP repeat protein [Streptomyces sp. NPDC051453]|uniref:FG-GAP repeat protein n=1 Tax=Streptomyces sp. NPDC051453 TaxID=3154941 RepID=UPI0034178D9C